MHIFRVRGFTLIEMLIVVAIIAILAALLAPSLQRSLETARTAVCLNNEHQIGVACTAYAMDNRGRLPNKGSWGRGTANGGKRIYGSNFWPVHVLPYVGKPDARVLDDVKGTVFICPNLDKTNHYNPATGVRDFNGWLGNNYGCNAAINGTVITGREWDDNGNLFSKPQYRQFAILSKIKNGHKVPLAADGGTNNCSFSIDDIYYKENSGAYSFRHNQYQSICVLFADNSARPLSVFTYCYDGKARAFTSYWAVTETF